MSLTAARRGVALLLCLSAACTPTTSTSSPDATTSPTPSAPSTQPAVVPDNATGRLLAAYEAARAALAADDPAAVVVTADSLAAVAAAYAGPGKADVDAGAAALAAVAFPEVVAQNRAAIDDAFAAARVAFGTVSRGVVAVVAADAALQPGRFLFECPMAQGYQRWVQLAPRMANPYMGQAMLECGTAVPAWRVAG